MGTIAEQITALEEENLRLKEYQKLVDKAIKLELGKSASEIKKMMSYNTPKTDEFVASICRFFDLHSDADMNLWLEIMLTENTLNAYQKGWQKLTNMALRGETEGPQNEAE